MLWTAGHWKSQINIRNPIEHVSWTQIQNVWDTHPLWTSFSKQIINKIAQHCMTGCWSAWILQQALSYYLTPFILKNGWCCILKPSNNHQILWLLCAMRMPGSKALGLFYYHSMLHKPSWLHLSGHSCSEFEISMLASNQDVRDKSAHLAQWPNIDLQ